MIDPVTPLAFRSDAVKLENFRFEEGEGDNENEILLKCDLKN